MWILVYFWWACRSGRPSILHVVCPVCPACSVSSAAVAWAILRGWTDGYKFRGRWTTNPHRASDVSNEYFCFTVCVCSQVTTDYITGCEQGTLSYSQFMRCFGWYYIAFDYMWVNENGEFVNWYWWENLNTWRKTCPSATSSTTNLTWTGLGLNSFLCSKTLMNSCWRHGMAVIVLMHLISLITINGDHKDGVMSIVTLL